MPPVLQFYRLLPPDGWHEEAWASYEKVYRSTPREVSPPPRYPSRCSKAAHPSFDTLIHVPAVSQINLF